MTRVRGLSVGQAQSRLAPLWQIRDNVIRGLTSRFVTHPWAVNFLMIVSPLVTWIWLGAIIIALGGLIALWPVPAFARRRPAPVPLPARQPASPVVAARELV
jgi:hypothetical protein